MPLSRIGYGIASPHHPGNNAFMPLPARKTAHLRHGRFSQAGVCYFLTICTEDREPVLNKPTEAMRILHSLTSLETSGDFVLHASTIMPDHLHLLFTLGSRLSLGQTMAKLKSLARDLGRAPWHWLEDGFEHRLRPDEQIEDYGFYIFMNPYRAHLIGTHEVWPWWNCTQPKMFRFTSHISANGSPPAAWLDVVEETAIRIASGE